MVILSWPILREFGKQHPDAASALKDWYQEVSLAEWRNLADVRLFSNSVDYVGNFRYVFNIWGNRYRLIAAIVFSTRTVFVKFVGTHQAYDKINAATIDYSKL
ncbi:type II toxin-antitoxin system HigB family toxin [Hymenobacter baengnokdamensis]|uniref:type II toxin-antitoxin system HigB family toxin n=1 Tax=Hymenobacter baengnokdamensis TaxID=2615203 RepID=UPI0012466313|nr:type II toxin-antitoxin system HigB family toxin [Hymenobacter baengnokdamensis]